MITVIDSAALHSFGVNLLLLCFVSGFIGALVASWFRSLARCIESRIDAAIIRRRNERVFGKVGE